MFRIEKTFSKANVPKTIRFEYSDAIVHAFRKFRAPFSGKAVHTFPEWSAVIYLVFRWNFYSMLFQECL